MLYSNGRTKLKSYYLSITLNNYIYIGNIYSGKMSRNYLSVGQFVWLTKQEEVRNIKTSVYLGCLFISELSPIQKSRNHRAVDNYGFELEMYYISCSIFNTDCKLSLASPNNIRVFSCTNNGLLTPA